MRDGEGPLSQGPWHAAPRRADHGANPRRDAMSTPTYPLTRSLRIPRPPPPRLQSVGEVGAGRLPGGSPPSGRVRSPPRAPSRPTRRIAGGRSRHAKRTYAAASRFAKTLAETCDCRSRYESCTVRASGGAVLPRSGRAAVGATAFAPRAGTRSTTPPGRARHGGAGRA